MFDSYSSTFGPDCGSPTRPHGFTYNCPIPRCGYRFPPDLEDVAVFRHGPVHTDQQWDEVLGTLTSLRGEVVAKHEAWLAALERDMARVGRWRDEGGQ